MGYSTTGIVEAAGDGVRGFAAGDRVVATAPHAEYSLCSLAADARADRLHRLHPELSFEQGTFHPLASSGAGWAQALEITADDRVAVLGQGLVGSLVMQFARRFRPAQLIAVDTLEIRCRIAREVGTPEVVHAGEEDPVEAVRRLTGGEGPPAKVDHPHPLGYATTSPGCRYWVHSRRYSLAVVPFAPRNQRERL